MKHHAVFRTAPTLELMIPNVVLRWRKPRGGADGIMAEKSDLLPSPAWEGVCVCWCVHICVHTHISEVGGLHGFLSRTLPTARFWNSALCCLTCCLESYLTIHSLRYLHLDLWEHFIPSSVFMTSRDLVEPPGNQSGQEAIIIHFHSPKHLLFLF